jgi:hypothetical protein
VDAGGSLGGLEREDRGGLNLVYFRLTFVPWCGVFFRFCFVQSSDFFRQGWWRGRTRQAGSNDL